MRHSKGKYCRLVGFLAGGVFTDYPESYITIAGLSTGRQPTDTFLCPIHILVSLAMLLCQILCLEMRISSQHAQADQLPLAHGGLQR